MVVARAAQALAPRVALLLNKNNRKNSFLYLVPEPADGLKVLQKNLLKIVPKFDNVNRFAGGFTPHLSVGQTRSRKARLLCAGWQATWRPLAFTLAHVYLIWRNVPPDDIFRVGPKLPLGRL